MRLTDKTRTDVENEAARAFDMLETKDGWETDIWFNCWWCWCIHCGSMSIHGNDDGYIAYLSGDPGKRGGASSNWGVSDIHKNPNDAIKETIEKAKLHIEECEKVIDSVNVVM